MLESTDRFISWQRAPRSLKIAKRIINHKDYDIAGVTKTAISVSGGRATGGVSDDGSLVTWRDASTQTEGLGDDSKRPKRMSESRKQYKRDYNKRLRASKKAMKAKDGPD